jgi:hypothetical protein
MVKSWRIVVWALTVIVRGLRDGGRDALLRVRSGAGGDENYDAAQLHGDHAEMEGSVQYFSHFQFQL